MTRAVFQSLHSPGHPQRQPYVRSLSFVDGKGPPPWDYFDQLQDHQAAYFGALCGRRASADADEFTESWFRAGYLGRMQIGSNIGMTVSPAATPDTVGIHGAASVLGGTGSLSFMASGAKYGLDADFLLTVKIKPVGVQDLDTAEQHGLVVGLGQQGLYGAYPSFAAGSDTDTWRTLWAPDLVSMPQVEDTGIPIVSATWYRLQISRVAGAVRWFINGQRVAVQNGLEGLYYPYTMLDARKTIEVARTTSGASGHGFLIDSCHLLAARSGA